MPYSEGVLRADVAAKVERHIASCARCAAELDMIRSVTCVLSNADMPVSEPANDLWAKVSARIADEPVRPTLSPKLGIAAGVAAAVLVGIVGTRLLTPVVPIQPTGVKTVSRVGTLTALQRAQKPVSKLQVRPHPPASKSSPVSEQRYFARSGGASSWYLKAKPGRPHRPVEMASAALKDAEAYRAAIPGRVPVASRPVVESCRAIEGAASAPPASTGDAVPIGGELRVGLGMDSAERAGSAAIAPAAAGAAVPVETETLASSSPGVGRALYGEARDAGYYSNDTTRAASTVSVVDELNETEGIRTAAIFSY